LNFITQLLPGLRDVRGPLIAGYLWLFAAWLLLGGHLPDRNTAEVYSHAFEVGDALGRVGIAAVVSIAAYLVGSLLQEVGNWIAFGYKTLKWRLKRLMTRLTLFSPAIRRLSPRSVEALLHAPPVFSLEDFRSVDGDGRTKRALEDLVSNRLRDCRKRLDDVLAQAAKDVRDGATRQGWSRADLRRSKVMAEAFGSPQRGWRVSRWVASVADHTTDERPKGGFAPLPSFSAAGDLFGERATIKTRLMETAEHAGSEVERFYAESDFRFTIAFPLAAVAVVMTRESSDWWWLVLLGVSLGLLAHSMVLRKHGGREMVEALRSRPNHEQLDQITPAFRRYEEDAERFAAALEAVKWEAMGAAIQRNGEDGEGKPPPSKSE
jgi:hypothetical protein